MPGMGRQRVGEHRDQRPCLFRVPAPVAAPRLVGPDGAEENARGQQRQPDDHRHFVDRAQLPEISAEGGCRERGDAAGRADTEKAVAGRDDRHMDHQPVGFEHRNQRRDLRVEPVQVRHEQRDASHQRGQSRSETRAAGEDQTRQYGRPADIDHRFVSVRPWRMAADVPAEPEAERLPCEHGRDGCRRDTGDPGRAAPVFAEHFPQGGSQQRGPENQVTSHGPTERGEAVVKQFGRDPAGV